MTSGSLQVEGMTCQSCVKSIESALKPFSTSLETSVQIGKVDYTILDPSLTENDIINCIEDCGFDVIRDGAIEPHLEPPAHKLPSPSPTTAVEQLPVSDSKACTIRVGGMTCASCVASITQGLQQLPGVHDAKVALLAEKAEVQFSGITSQEICNAIEDLGFEASLISESTDKRHTTIAMPNKLRLRIFGMTCGSCVNAIETGLSQVNGILSVKVNLATEQGEVEYDANLTGPRSILAEIGSLGFDALIRDENKNERNAQLESLQRIKEIQKWKNRLIVAASFMIPLMFIHMFLPLISSSAKMWLMQPFAGAMFAGISRMDMIEFILSTPVQFISGKPFYEASAAALKHGNATMDVLVVLGTTAAYGWSILSMIISILSWGNSEAIVFFETSAMLITFVVLGRYLENIAKGRTSSALSRLLSLNPTTATLLTLRDNDPTAVLAEEKIDVELVQLNDVLKVFAGEKFPADGEVVWGDSSADESLISGESLPVAKHPGSQVIAGSVNGSGVLFIKATRVGKDTTLSQIVQLVEDAQTSKAPIQAYADKVAGIFVPTVVMLAGLTFIMWMIILNVAPQLAASISGDSSTFILCLKMCISVVVVACPCTLGLATPTAVMVGTGVGAQLGILIKGGGPMEMAGKITKVIFDKTGTLTMGKIQVVEVVTMEDASTAVSPNTSPVMSAPLNRAKDDILSMLGAAEANSEHPLGKAIAAYAKQALNVEEWPCKVVSYQAEVGSGIVCEIEHVQHHKVLIGNETWIRSQGTTIPPRIIDRFSQHAARGHTVVFCSVDGHFAAMIALSDLQKPEAAIAVSALKKMGLQVCMVTGDSERTARTIARRCGIDEVHASISPAGKMELVRQYQSSGHKVAMVGDGINDAVAISASDLGIAVGAGTDVALEAAQIVLVKDNLADVITAIDLSREIFKRIRLNFAFSTVYNVFMIPIAMGCLIPFGIVLPPMAAGFAMAMSSVSVVLSSLMLKNYSKPQVAVQVDLAKERASHIPKEMVFVEMEPVGESTWFGEQWDKLVSYFRRDHGHLPVPVTQGGDTDHLFDAGQDSEEEHE